MTDLLTDGHRLILPDGREAACSMGRSGLIEAAEKREGDGATPLGRWKLLEVRFRPDRIDPPVTPLSLRALAETDGWCDAPEDPAYNRPVLRPYPASHEAMWRNDGLYDIVVITDHNTDPVLPGLGSAIFLHCRHETGRPTAGCIALDRSLLQGLLAEIDSDSWLDIRRTI